MKIQARSYSVPDARIAGKSFQKFMTIKLIEHLNMKLINLRADSKGYGGLHGASMKQS